MESILKCLWFLECCKITTLNHNVARHWSPSMCSESRHNYGINKPSPAKTERRRDARTDSDAEVNAIWHDKGCLSTKNSCVSLTRLFSIVQGRCAFFPHTGSLFSCSSWTWLFVFLYHHPYESLQNILSKPYALAKTEWLCIVPFNDETCSEGDNVD